MSTNQIVSPYDEFADQNPELQAFVRQELADKNLALSNSAVKFITTSAILIASKRIPGAGILNINSNPTAQISINGVSRAWDISNKLNLQGYDWQKALVLSFVDLVATIGTGFVIGAMGITIGAEIALVFGASCALSYIGSQVYNYAVDKYAVKYKLGTTNMVKVYSPETPWGQVLKRHVLFICSSFKKLLTTFLCICYTLCILNKLNSIFIAG